VERTSDLNIAEAVDLVSPLTLKRRFPMTAESNRTVVESREIVRGIVAGRDKRLLAIVGPCSIHDPPAALEYARNLQKLKQKLEERIYLVMRVYFEKPRTSLGWQGLIIDPHLDGSSEIGDGLATARHLLLQITALGLGAATEILDPIVPQYIDDLLSWAAIGARTTESQTHRNMASGLSMPVGFKNNTEGNLQTAVDAMASAKHPHSFIGIDQEGRTCILKTKGNRDTHIVLRGSRSRANYRRKDILRTVRLLRDAGFQPAVMVDCSHGNSRKIPSKQGDVLMHVLRQRADGMEQIIGFMVESNLKAGNQPMVPRIQDLEFGVSVTDPCIGWSETQRILERAYRRHLPAE
jgi:3-deoxy-7-phosphoheptulonate synthase